MKHQRLSWWCGPAAVANALECLGIHEDQEKIAVLCHVTKKLGTPEEEILRALLAFRVKVDILDKPAQRVSMAWLRKHLRTLGPAVLCVDNHSHWVTAIGVVADRILLFDPSAGKGLQLHTRKTLLARWRLAPTHGGPTYYGIGCAL